MTHEQPPVHGRPGSLITLQVTPPTPSTYVPPPSLLIVSSAASRKTIWHRQSGVGSGLWPAARVRRCADARTSTANQRARPHFLMASSSLLYTPVATETAQLLLSSRP